MSNLQKISENIELIISAYLTEQGLNDIEDIDSFGFIQIILQIEEFYDIEIDENFLTLETIKDLTQLESYIFEKIS